MDVHTIHMIKKSIIPGITKQKVNHQKEKEEFPSLQIEETYFKN